ncbi:MAG: AAA family ATPase [Bacteroidales bacterium]
MNNLFIRDLEVKNFKGFENNLFEFKDQFTVIIGNNAMGKTSVLDALSIAAGSFFLGIDVAQQRGILKGEIRSKTLNSEPKPQLPVLIKATGFVNTKEITWIRSIDKITKKLTTKFREATTIKNIANDMLIASRSGEPISFPVIAYHGTGRLWAEHETVTYSSQSEGVEMAYKNCLSPKSSSREFLSWYKTYEDEINKFGGELEITLLNAFKQTIMDMIPDNAWQEMAYSFVAEDLVGIFNKEKKLYFSQLSDGFRNMIGMVADIAYRCIKLNPHLGDMAIKETTGIVLIDEIDLHLHPTWQRHIVEDLTRCFPKIQFVVTTHSPFIVQSLNSLQMINLDERQLMDDPNKVSLETNALYMGVKSVNGINFSKKEEAANNFFKLLMVSDSELDRETVESTFLEYAEKYSNDPLFVAQLKFEKMARLTQKKDETSK